MFLNSMFFAGTSIDQEANYDVPKHDRWAYLLPPVDFVNVNIEDYGDYGRIGFREAIAAKDYDEYEKKLLRLERFFNLSYEVRDLFETSTTTQGMYLKEGSSLQGEILINLSAYKPAFEKIFKTSFNPRLAKDKRYLLSVSFGNKLLGQYSIFSDVRLGKLKFTSYDGKRLSTSFEPLSRATSNAIVQNAFKVDWNLNLRMSIFLELVDETI